MKLIHFVVQNVGFYDAPTCKAVCPIDCIKQDPAHIENKEQLLEKFKGLNLIGSFSSKTILRIKLKSLILFFMTMLRYK